MDALPLLLFAVVFVLLLAGYPVSLTLGGVSLIFGLLTFGFDFFNGEDFYIKWNKEQSQFTVTPKKNIKNIVRLLDYICNNLSDKLFYSGVKYELNEEEKLQLFRTKEKLKIIKISSQKYKLERTNSFEVLK